MIDLNSNLVDSFGRVAEELTHFSHRQMQMRCIYCMPTNNTDWFEQESILTFDEIIRVVTILADLGVDRIRLTGGEPLVRPNISILIKGLSKIPGIRAISMTTNGLGLQSSACDLKNAGLGSVNVSLDTLRNSRLKVLMGYMDLKMSLGGSKRLMTLDFTQK